MDLVPIKVLIGLKEKGYANYPDFNIISRIIRKNLDWSNYVDTYGLGWHYDKKSGHKEHTDDSPYGQQWGVLIIPKEFADEAIRLFPDKVIKMNEEELEIFYDEHAHYHEPDEKIDEKVLNSINSKKEIGRELTENQKKALDPDDPTPGIVKNKKKKWKDFKNLVGVNIVE